DLVASLSHDEAAGDAFEQAGDLRNACQQQVNAGFELMEMGAYAEAERTFRQGLVRAERMGLETVCAMARLNLGLVLAHLGRLDEAREMESAALEKYVASGNLCKEVNSRTYLAIIESMAGHAEAAEKQARVAVDLACEPTGI